MKNFPLRITRESGQLDIIKLQTFLAANCEDEDLCERVSNLDRCEVITIGGGTVPVIKIKRSDLDAEDLNDKLARALTNYSDHQQSELFKRAKQKGVCI